MPHVYTEHQGDVTWCPSATANSRVGDVLTPPGSAPNSIHSGTVHSGVRSTIGSTPTSISDAGCTHSESECVKPTTAADSSNSSHSYSDEQPEFTKNEVLGETIRPPVYCPIPEKIASAPHPNNAPASPQPKAACATDDKDEESSVPKSLDRSEKRNIAGPDSSKKELLEKGEGIRRMYKFKLYETTMRYYIVGSDLQETRFRILKIDRTADMGDLSIIEDEGEYTREQVTTILSTIESGNIISGGWKFRFPFWGLLGFIRFTGAYYMLLITKRSIVAMIGGHYIYRVGTFSYVVLTFACLQP